MDSNHWLVCTRATSPLSGSDSPEIFLRDPFNWMIPGVGLKLFCMQSMHSATELWQKAMSQLAGLQNETKQGCKL